MVVEPSSCLLCGEVFEPRRRGGRPQKYCSPKCRKLAADKAWRDRNRPDRPTACAECGGPIVVTDKTVRIFCSDKCKQRAHNRRARRALPPLARPTEKTCPQCGETFLAKSRNRIYCYGRWCAQAAYHERRAAGKALTVVERVVKCDGCGTEFTGRHPSARWCSKVCANRHWGLVRARQRGQTSAARYTDLEIFTRDKWTCHICRKKVRRNVDRLHPEGATIDHLIPISKGGSDEPSNVATAHWKCNRDKSAGSANDQLALI